MLRTIVTYPAQNLAQPAEAVPAVDEEVQSLISDMIDTMRAHRGVGLAAPQVGINKQVIIVKGDSGEPIAIVNPRIIGASGGKVESVEGCLSIPGHLVKLTRYRNVRVQGLDRVGEPLLLEAEGLLAAALQHEIDHLGGLLIVDRLPETRKTLFKVKFRTSQRPPRVWACA